MKSSQLCILTFISFMMILNSCAVVRTPYFQTSYYKNTIERLNTEKDSIRFSRDSLFAGFSRISITPDDSMISGKRKKTKGVPMAGYGQLKTRYATGVHDSIYVRAVAIKSGSDMSVIVSADLLLMPPDIIDTVIFRLHKRGINRDQLFFSATHTHSSLGGWGYGALAKIIAGKQNQQIKSWIAEKIGKAVLDATTDLEPASMESGEFSAPQFTINRLTHDPGQLNSDFNYLAILRRDSTRAVIGVYSAHATTIRSGNTLLSGDYPGYWERALEHSGFSVAMFCGGSMANQSPYGPGEIFESAGYIGSSLADSVKKKLGDHNGEMIEKACLSVNVGLPPYHLRMSKNRNFTSSLSRKMMQEPENVLLQALRINNLVWFFTPGDFSGESARLMKKILKGRGFDCAISGYNGSYIGYILPGKYFWMKHYESRTMSWFGPFLGDYMLDIMEQMSNLITQ